MNDPKHLRAEAVEMYALALRIRDVEPAYANVLIERAVELQAQATAIEGGADLPLAIDAPHLQAQELPQQDEK